MKQGARVSYAVKGQHRVSVYKQRVTNQANQNVTQVPDQIGEIQRRLCTHCSCDWGRRKITQGANLCNEAHAQGLAHKQITGWTPCCVTGALNTNLITNATGKVIKGGACFTKSFLFNKSVINNTLSLKQLLLLFQLLCLQNLPLPLCLSQVMSPSMTQSLFLLSLETRFNMTLGKPVWKLSSRLSVSRNW